MSDTLRVVIVDDHPLFREGVAHTLRAAPGIEIVGEGGAADEAIHLARERQPDVILLDIGIPGGGLNAARTIAKDACATKIVMFTASEDEDDVAAALRAGVQAYILKGVPARELVRILRAVSSGERYVPPALAAALLSEMMGSARSRRDDVFDTLTDRERQILEKVAAGFSNKEIGNDLYLSEKTVKHHMTNILQKLGVRNRVEAALLAQKRHADS